jgi:superfamily II DNA or RNA helicase
MKVSTGSALKLALPACWATEITVDKNRARQLLAVAANGVLEQANGRVIARHDQGFVPLVSGPAQISDSHRALKVGRAALRDPSLIPAVEAKWLGDLDPLSPATVRASYLDAFGFLQEDPDTNRAGLRSPQIGAIHAVLGYWTTGTTRPGTVVMPTGTGKTETMVALLVAARVERLIVVVPSDALRTQIASKFETLGLLRGAGVIASSAHFPVVGQIGHKFESAESAVAFASACNVLVTTPQALFASGPDVFRPLLDACSHLFVDEAHHVEAATWRQIRDEFAEKPVLQFTATPYREDGRQLVGRMVYAFPLREAQRQGYFSTINYRSVVDFDDPDEAIARRAIEQLREDLAAGRGHLLMARVKRTGRARELRERYAEFAPDLRPVVVHSYMPVRERQAALAAIRSGESKIIVCVDMLGEGFDLPALKIAAIHDPHKSLGVTLQFVGRFARVTGNLGGATVVVGRPDSGFDRRLRELFAEDADWNLIIRDLSESAVGEQEEVSEFEAGFRSLPEEVSLRNLEPKMSTVVYRTATQSWNPSALVELFGEEQLLTIPIAVNEQAHVAWFVTETRSPVQWGDLRVVEEVAYGLYVLYWNEEKQRLYINSSNNKSAHEALARAVCGDNVKHVAGETVYRVMARISRLVPTNVGLLDIRNRSRRFSMHVGADVVEGFPVAEQATKAKTNIFAYGYENGGRVSIGAAVKKGRIWSHRVAPTLKQWTDWCDHIGEKLDDEGISLDEVMRSLIRPEIIEERPALVPLAMEWGWESLLSTTEGVRVEANGESWPLLDVDLRITEFNTRGPIPFVVTTPRFEAAYEAVLSRGRVQYRPRGAEAEVLTSRRRIPLSEYLAKVGPNIIFEQEATLVPPGMLLKPNREISPFDSEKLRVIDWGDTDLSREVQGAERDSRTIQAYAIRHVLAQAEWDVVMDDHGSGEIADIVALRIDGDDLIVSLTHCKSTSGTPGARLSDLYEVCGQAQKSARWRRNVTLMLRHLIRREQRRRERCGRQGFEKGDGNALYRLDQDAPLLRAILQVTVAQPGVSKAGLSLQQAELLGATDVYLYESAYASLDVLCSA